jgi:hypothetical protein
MMHPYLVANPSNMTEDKRKTDIGKAFSYEPYVPLFLFFLQFLNRLRTPGLILLLPNYSSLLSTLLPWLLVYGRLVTQLVN